jgi:hypothetical protein
MTPTQFMNLEHHPLRLKAAEAGWCLGFNRDEMRVCSSTMIINRIRAAEPKLRKLLLTSNDRLLMLGKPWGSCRKHYAEIQIRQREADEAWLDRAVRTIRLYWRYKKTWGPEEDPNNPTEGQD